MTSSPPAIDQQITFLYTQDLEATTPFYEEVLRLKPVLEHTQCRVYRVTRDSFLGICFARAGRYVEPKGVVYTFVTSDVDGWHQWLSGHNLPELGQVKKGEVTHAFFVRDPNGYILEFQSFVTPEWPPVDR